MSHDCKLIAPQARDDITFTKHLRKPFPDLTQNRVSRSMPIRIVDRFELIEIEQKHHSSCQMGACLL